ncbi:hypothetical protein COV18_02000 [Candidatus Woesearchaeota archaeon CG10_big_fil_rev_8_21_14_0_10_37_12]|nr:MAG: hypothetical protein COV18_02000 [Candidatus Woesearchaeota archaeon CG10_big_fil_rev_8_21_14_0_10_37_12]
MHGYHTNKMPHQCVRCNKMYEDAAQELLSGCECGARLFFYIKKEKLAVAKQVLQQNMNLEQKKQMEEDVLDLVGSDHSAPVVLDFESIRVTKPGQYELDLVKLFKQDPLVFKLEEGKYIIDVAQSFEKHRKKHNL